MIPVEITMTGEGRIPEFGYLLMVSINWENHTLQVDTNSSNDEELISTIAPKAPLPLVLLLAKGHSLTSLLSIIAVSYTHLTLTTTPYV